VRVIGASASTVAPMTLTSDVTRNGITLRKSRDRLRSVALPPLSRAREHASAPITPGRAFDSSPPEIRRTFNPEVRLTLETPESKRVETVPVAPRRKSPQLRITRPRAFLLAESRGIPCDASAPVRT
jgi:hypothetical protein